MDEFVIFELRCGRCLTTFFVCRPDYRGQVYCSAECSELEEAALHRAANTRHQRSDEGRQDHAAHQRALVERKRAETQALTGEGRQEVAPRAQWSPPKGPMSLTTSGPEVDGRANADD